MANPVQIPISTCLCPDPVQMMPNASENDFKQLVILGIANLVLSLTKMAYYKASSIVEKKDLHTKLEEIKQSSNHGSMLLRNGNNETRT
jgi:hypothetical protein